MNEIETILSDRGRTHGAFSMNAKVSQDFKEILRKHPTYFALPNEHKEALDNIFQKIARVLNGNLFHEDNWIDIIGYAQLALDYVRENKPESKEYE